MNDCICEGVNEVFWDNDFKDRVVKDPIERLEIASLDVWRACEGIIFGVGLLSLKRGKSLLVSEVDEAVDGVLK